jgi:hypothetical protein
MAEQKQEGIKDYADGWIKEREGTDVPGFLKLAIPVIALFCIGYVVVYMNGEVGHADRGLLVQKFNEVTQSSSGLMYAVAALMVVYGIIVVAFAIRKKH